MTQVNRNHLAHHVRPTLDVFKQDVLSALAAGGQAISTRDRRRLAKEFKHLSASDRAAALAHLQSASPTLARFAQHALAHVGRRGDVTAGQVARDPAAVAGPPGSAYLQGLTGTPKDIAKQLGVSGQQDVRRINKAVDQLKTASASVSPAAPGEKGGPGKLVLTPEEAERVRNAPDMETAKAEVAKAIERQTGVSLADMGKPGKKSRKQDAARRALNELLGTKVKNGQEKNAGSALVLDSIMESTAQALRSGGQTPAARVLSMSQGVDGVGNFPGTVGRPDVTTPEGPVSVDLNDYVAPTRTVSELGSPLIFDLSGTGLKIRAGEHVEVDLDGDGRKEVITNLERGTGLLVFDSKFKPTDGKDYGAGRDFFGDGTDLTGYGIVGPGKDGGFANGFDALRALCEHFDRVHGTKQTLDAADLGFLESHCGLRMRLDGVVGGEDRKFSEVGITRIALGRPDRIQSLEEAAEDPWGNKLMKQEGATFVVKGVTREYADIWFNILARKAPAKKKAPVVKGAVAKAVKPAVAGVKRSLQS
jgi:hypothetical protein